MKDIFKIFDSIIWVAVIFVRFVMGLQMVFRQQQNTNTSIRIYMKSCLLPEHTSLTYRISGFFCLLVCLFSKRHMHLLSKSDGESVIFLWRPSLNFDFGKPYRWIQRQKNQTNITHTPKKNRKILSLPLISFCMCIRWFVGILNRSKSVIRLDIVSQNQFRLNFFSSLSVSLLTVFSILHILMFTLFN